MCRVFAESDPSLIRVGEYAESQASRVFAESESDYTGLMYDLIYLSRTSQD